MPELPEVETTRRGIAPHLVGRRIEAVRVRQPRLRWPVAAELPATVGQTVAGVGRRGKYLVIELQRGSLILHLGMSGSLRLVETGTPPRPHDHVDWTLDSGRVLRLHDPRRFGAVLWGGDAPLQHPLLRALGPEPLEPAFDGAYLYRLSRGRRGAVKNFLMDSHVVVGVGNIYASESLFLAGIDPRRAAGRVGPARYRALVEAVREVLARSIEMGGTTLRDFLGADGSPGYFRQTLRVYERAGQPCRRCGRPIRRLVIGQRASYYCPGCQR